jgi:predicted ATP-grasp superfamily ATP-dependent carboligase
VDVFVGEYVCGGGFARKPLERIPESLRREGQAMLTSLIEDFALIANSVHVAWDDRFVIPQISNVVTHRIVNTSPLWPQWIAAASGCDRAIIVAPETDGVLAQSVAMLHASGIDVMNGYGDFLRCASDKYETARILSVAGVPHPPTWTCETVPDSDPSGNRRWVVKPRDGCGMSHLTVFDSFDAAIEAAWGTTNLIQPWVEGRPISIAVIVGGNELMILPAVGQMIDEQKVAYSGGYGPLCEEDHRRAAALACAAIQALPRTVRGFVGLDLILADNPAEDCVIEINPRVTTSYIGLRRIVQGNLAARIAGLDREPVQCVSDCRPLQWSACGDVWPIDRS